MSSHPLAEVTEDWAQFDPVAYLAEYYADIGSENLALLRFLAETFRDIPKGGLMLDFGAGPTIYPLISAVTRVDEIHFSDYVEANLAEVQRWIDKDSAAFDWNLFIRQALEIESGKPCSDTDIDRRADQIRERVTQLITCDASRTPPVDCKGQPYDVVLTNFCAESATADRDQWHAYMENIVSVLKPGGRLIMSALKGATRYAVGTRMFPAVDITEDDLISFLEEMGFCDKGIEVRSVSADRPTREYAGLIFAVATKKVPNVGGAR